VGGAGLDGGEDVFDCGAGGEGVVGSRGVGEPYKGRLGVLGGLVGGGWTDGGIGDD
jgi:hypothetical protein